MFSVLCALCSMFKTQSTIIRPRMVSNLLQSLRNNSTKETETKLPQKVEANESEVIQKEYDPKDVTKEDLQWRTPRHETEREYYNVFRTFYKEDNNRNLLHTLQHIDLSPSSIKRWWANRKIERDILLQSYIPERNQVLGNELAAAHFLVHRGGAVKFYDEEKWIKADEHNDYTLPRFYEEGKYLQAIDCTDMNLYYEGLANLNGLKQVEWLSLNGCEHIDDWCIDRISSMLSHSLIYLDLRNCPKITHKGLGALYKMRKLKTLYLDDFLRSTTYEMTCLLLQEINPHLDIKSDAVVFHV